MREAELRATQRESALKRNGYNKPLNEHVIAIVVTKLVTELLRQTLRTLRDWDSCVVARRDAAHGDNPWMKTEIALGSFRRADSDAITRPAHYTR